MIHLWFIEYHFYHRRRVYSARREAEIPKMWFSRAPAAGSQRHLLLCLLREKGLKRKLCRFESGGLCLSFCAPKQIGVHCDGYAIDLGARRLLEEVLCKDEPDFASLQRLQSHHAAPKCDSFPRESALATEARVHYLRVSELIAWEKKLRKAQLRKAFWSRGGFVIRADATVLSAHALAWTGGRRDS